MNKENLILRLKNRNRNDEGEVYDYSNTFYLDKKPLEIICHIHGIFYQHTQAHIDKNGMCPGCRKQKESNEYLLKIKDRRNDKGLIYDYSKTIKNGKDKIIVICKEHGEFLQHPFDHLKNCGCPKCGDIRTVKIKKEKYGDNYFKDLLKEISFNKGVENISQLEDIKNKKKETFFNNYGTTYGKCKEIEEKKKKTNLKKYGTEYIFQNKDIKKKSLETKIKKGSFDKSNSSKEATEYIKNYIKLKGYDKDQVAYSDIKNGYFEWGYFYNEKWMLFDLVVFKKGKRGDINSIIEILEYQGPFHYTLEDVKERGDKNSTPYKSCRISIKESYEKDKLKEEFANKYSKKFTIIYSDHKKRN